MPELREQLRDFIESGARPVTADEVLARRFPARRSSSPMSPPVVRRFAMYAAVAVAAAVVALIVGLAVAPAGPRLVTRGLSVPTVLAKAATAAAVEPSVAAGPGQFLYVRTLTGSVDFTGSSPGKPLEQFYVQQLNQLWSTATGAVAVSSEVVGVPRFVSGRDRAAWRADGSKLLRSGTGGGATAAFYDVADLPTDPARLNAYFTRQGDLTPRPPSGRDAAWRFTTALDFLQGGASSAQRAALLRYIDTIPGVRDQGSATTLGTNATGTLLSISSDQRKESVQAILDVATSQLLEVRTVDAAQGGRIGDYSDFIFSGVADAARVAPPGAPPLPVAWPHGTGKEPAPGSVYPSAR
jgi:hypothetical protein